MQSIPSKVHRLNLSMVQGVRLTDMKNLILYGKFCHIENWGKERLNSLLLIQSQVSVSCKHDMNQEMQIWFANQSGLITFSTKMILTLKFLQL